MYNLPYFKEKDQQVVLEFMKAHPFAMLIGCRDNLPHATQIPFLFEAFGIGLFGFTLNCLIKDRHVFRIQGVFSCMEVIAPTKFFINCMETFCPTNLSR